MIDSYGYQIDQVARVLQWQFFAGARARVPYAVPGRPAAAVSRGHHARRRLGSARLQRRSISRQPRGDVARRVLGADLQVQAVRVPRDRVLRHRATSGVGAARLAGSRISRRINRAGTSWFRSDVGAGLRVYVSTIVLPLLGFDVAYGIEVARAGVLLRARAYGLLGTASSRSIVFFVDVEVRDRIDLGRDRGLDLLDARPGSPSG